MTPPKDGTHAKEFPARDALRELVRLSEKLGLYETTQMEVCTAHRRVLCCRHGTQDSPCTWSRDPADIAAVTSWQRGEQ